MEQWSSLLQDTVGRLGPYAPRVMGALAVLLLAWIGARLARAGVVRVVHRRRLEERLQTPELGSLLGTVAYGVVWLLALPALLDALALDGLLAPVNAMLARLLGVLPNALGAAAILGVGWLAARILRQLVTGLLTAAGSERLAARIGLTQALGDNSLAGLAGSVLFVLVLLPTLTAALQTLGLEVLARPVGHLLDQVVELVPRLISAAVIVAIGAVLGRLLAGLVTALFAAAGLNRLPERLGLPADVRVNGRDLSELAGGLAMAAALWLSVTQASEVLGFGVLTEAVASLGAVLARLVAGLLVFTAGLWLAALAARLVAASTVRHAALLSRVARAAVLFFAGALALREAGLPADIVSIAFGAVVGGLALAAAIALGFGGREVAARLLESAAESFGQPKDRAEGEPR